jgi:rSAM/selenodomain-associated transferase 1
VTAQVTVLVLAKEPLPGRVKTRLCPPLTSEGAARLAAAAIEDTLEVVRQVAVARRVLVLDGAYDAPGFEVLPQRGGPMAERLAAAFDDAGELPALLVGMDTPQLTPDLLTEAVEALVRSDAVLGTAPDGGWWLLGLRRPDGALLRDIPTSQEDTGARQLARLELAGLSVHRLPELRDVDTIADALAVAELAPGSRFAAELACQHEGPSGSGA